MLKRFIPVILLILTGCSDLKFPWVYRISIDQGNIITQDMVNQLKPGLSKSQVQFVMGSALITDTFNENRWDYVYTMETGKGVRTQQRLTVFFQDDKLSGLTGDFMPQQAANDVAPTPTVKPVTKHGTATDVNENTQTVDPTSTPDPTRPAEAPEPQKPSIQP